jgi:hypothetical protein
VSVRTTPIRLHLDRYNDQETFDQLYGILRDVIEKHRTSRIPSVTEATARSGRGPSVDTTAKRREPASGEVGRGTSKYYPLREFLEETPSGVQERTVSFKHVESILGFALPASARRHRAWWSNPSSPGHHTHAQAWLRAGWEVDTVDQQEEWVRFRRAG